MNLKGIMLNEKKKDNLKMIHIVCFYLYNICKL